MDTIHPLEPVSWSSVPLALRITFPDATRHALRITLRRRRLPHHDAQQLAPDGSPVYPKVTGSQALHCYWCYTSAHTCRPIAWLLPVKAGLCLRFQRNTQRVLRLILPTSGTAPLEQDGFTVELLPKLAFFTLWDRPPSTGLASASTCNDAAGGLPSGGPPSLRPRTRRSRWAAARVQRCSSQMMPRLLLMRPRLRSTWSLTPQNPLASDSDDSSDVAVVEPVDQAAAEVPCVADLL